MKKRLTGITALCLILIASVFLTACGNNDSSSAQKDDGTLNLAETADIPTLDPAHVTDTTSSEVIYMTRSGLTRMHNGELEWDLASSKPEVSQDKTVYTFKIREDAKWSDGSPVTAEDFVYAWHRIVNPETASEYSFIFSAANIKNAADILDKDSDMYGKVDKLGVKAIDDHTLQVTLDKPTPYFTSILFNPQFFPLKKQFVEKQGEDFAAEPDKQLYNGPYVLSSWNHGSGWTYEKNDKYWNKDRLHIKKVSVKVIKEGSTRMNLYKTGKLDMANLSSEYIDQFKGTDDLHKGLDAAMYFIRLNQSGNKLLKNKKARQAIYLAIDRKGMTDVILNDGSIPAKYFIPKNFVKGPDGKGFRETAPESYLSGGKDKAEQLWKQAKKEVGVDSVTLEYMSSDSELSSKMAEYISNQLEITLPGLSVKITKLPWKAFLKRQDSLNYDISDSGWAPDYQDPVSFLQIMTSGDANNDTGYSSEKYDNLLQKIKNSGSDPEKRWKLMQKAEKMILTDVPIVPLYQNGNAYALKPYVKGLDVPTVGPQVDWLDAKITK